MIFAMTAKSYATKKMGAKEVVVATGRMIAIGPLAAALTLLWDRDELVLGRGEDTKKKGS